MNITYIEQDFDMLKVLQEAYRKDNASNNWLKMHGYPMRRKMHNKHRVLQRREERRKKRQGFRTHKVFMVDEFHLLRLSGDAAEHLKTMMAISRSYNFNRSVGELSQDVSSESKNYKLALPPAQMDLMEDLP